MGNRYTYSQTFEEWCIENNRQDILDLWDYEKNDKLPSEVPRGTKTEYYFKCPNGIHESESRRLSLITDKPDHVLICKQCAGSYGGIQREDLTGMIFGDLIVLSLDEDRTAETKFSYWWCKCTCGNIISVQSSKLKGGRKTICGGRYKHKSNPKFDEDNNILFDTFSPDTIKNLRRGSNYYHYRQEVLKKDENRCIVCGITENIEVHHIYPFASYPHDRFNPETGICLCSEHHSVSKPESFHSLYGRFNNTPEQLQEYVNMKRKELGIEEYFDVYEYMNSYNSNNLEIDDTMLDF